MPKLLPQRHRYPKLILLGALIGVFVWTLLPPFGTPLELATRRHLTGVTYGTDHISPNRTRSLSQRLSDFLAGPSSLTAPAQLRTCYDNLVFWTIDVPSDMGIDLQIQAFAWDNLGNGAQMMRRDTGYVWPRKNEEVWPVPVTPLWGEDIYMSFYTNIQHQPPFLTVKAKNPLYGKKSVAPAQRLPITTSTEILEATLVEFVTSVDDLATCTKVDRRLYDHISPSRSQSMLSIRLRDLTQRRSDWRLASAWLEPRELDTSVCGGKTYGNVVHVFILQASSDIYDINVGLVDVGPDSGQDIVLENVDVSASKGRTTFTTAIVDGAARQLDEPLFARWWRQSPTSSVQIGVELYPNTGRLEPIRLISVTDTSGTVLRDTGFFDPAARYFDFPPAQGRVNLRVRRYDTAWLEFRASPVWKQMPRKPE